MLSHKRFQNLKDLFEVRCKKCNSTDVDLSSHACRECGTIIEAECNNCNSKYNYHDFKQIKVEYDKKGNEVI